MVHVHVLVVSCHGVCGIDCDSSSFTNIFVDFFGFVARVICLLSFFFTSSGADRYRHHHQRDGIILTAR